MGLQKCGLNLNSAGKELLPHGSLEFPCAGYSDKYTENPENIIPWHWHEELEIAYIKEGTLRLKIQSKSFFLEKGDCFAINSNAIHYASAFPSCELQTIVFSPSLITGNNESVFAKKYILPGMRMKSWTPMNSGRSNETCIQSISEKRHYSYMTN